MEAPTPQGQISVQGLAARAVGVDALLARWDYRVKWLMSVANRGATHWTDSVIMRTEAKHIEQCAKELRDERDAEAAGCSVSTLHTMDSAMANIAEAQPVSLAERPCGVSVQPLGDSVSPALPAAQEEEKD